MALLTNHAHAHSEIIVCPNCNATQKACVLHSVPWWTYIHECTECQYVIMESEWNRVAQPKTEKAMKTSNPICPDDLMECTQHSELTLSGTANCHNCERHYHGVKATGAMPGLEQLLKWISKKLKR